MALSANTVFEVRLTGNDTNGGGFVTGASGTDWSQQTSPQYSVTDGVTAGTTTITSASAAFGTDVIGNIISVSGGTGAVVQSWYQITARPSATQITVDRATGLTSGTGVTLKIGGALFSPGAAGAAIVAGGSVSGNTVFIQYNASPYVVTSASTNIAEGCVLGTAGSYWIGYDASRTRYPAVGGNRPTVQLNTGVSNAVIFTGTNNAYFLQNLILDCNNQTTSRAGLMSGEYFYVKAMNGTWNTTGGVLQDNSVGRAIYCEVSNCTLTSAANGIRLVGNAFFCWVHDNAIASGSHGLTAVNAVGCISNNNTGGGGFSAFNTAVGCIAYGNGQHGFFPQNTGGTYINCIAENNGTLGWVGGTSRYCLMRCASYNNTTARSSAATGQVFDIDPILGSGSFFTNAAGADFTTNTTAGAGALLRETAFPDVFLPGQTDYRDVGAFQHQDTGGGGSTGISRARGASGF